MERYNLCVVLVSLVPPSPAVLLADPQWTSSDEHTCSRMKMTSPYGYGYAGSLRGTCPASAQTSNWHSETQISSLEIRAATMSHDKSKSHGILWYTYARGFILKKIQWHIHAGSWSLVNCWREGSYEALYKVLMNINESGCRPYGWPRPWWWSVYPRDTPTVTTWYKWLNRWYTGHHKVIFSLKQIATRKFTASKHVSISQLQWYIHGLDTDYILFN